ncbi:MAG TPA: isoaspartyl peptidase/L-asparaginase [Thermoanaerobaculia bacterium]|nr:isoaspartyl peptidase/L-asparaginase [Thermoanaerobaculia bacterium]
MKQIAALALFCSVLFTTQTFAESKTKPRVLTPVIVIHGGAGTILKKNMTPEQDAAYRDALTLALKTGHDILKKGGSSVDAVEAAIRTMEDSPLFNAGKGSVFTHEGRNELDASIMDGKNQTSGAVAGVTIVKNPISAARAVMEHSPHVLLIGKGAELFATRMGLEIVDPSYFWTERRWKELQKELLEENKDPHAELISGKPEKFGTVGAVALDRAGNLAAGTSTGGTSNKYFGRVGDSPIIGAGTYADKSCAISATGHGEDFIRFVVAHDIAALVEYKGLSIDRAANIVIHEKLKSAGGDGGVIALDSAGNFSMTFNTEGMYRGYYREGGSPRVMIYGDEK